MIDRFNLKPGIKENIELKIKNDSDFSKLFSENIFGKSEFYKVIKNKLYDAGKYKKIHVIDAF
jgi:hypothetical protein